MNAPCAAVVVAALALAGCLEASDPAATGGGDAGAAFPLLAADPPIRDYSVETLGLSVRADGPFRVGLPLPLSVNVTTAEDWYRNITLPGMGSAAVTLRESERGPVLLLDGDDGVSVRSIVIELPQRGNRCCAEAFLDMRWSTSGDDWRAVWVWVDEGLVDVAGRYSADANSCDRSESFAAEGLTGGWVRIDVAPGSGGCA